jgi:hypothetical protein
MISIEVLSKEVIVLLYDELALQAYCEINRTAKSNMLLQGGGAIFGGSVTMGIDVAVVGTHYLPMFNRIRRIYGRDPVGSGVIIPIVGNLSHELLFDLTHDKILGHIPVVGIYFNVICAKTLTWRLGVLFAMLASLGTEIESSLVKDCVYVIRNMFPQNSAYKLAQPDRETFTQIVTSVHNNSPFEFEEKINKAKAIFA